MRELRDSKTGEAITPESIAAQLAEKGVSSEVEPAKKEEPKDVKEESPKEEAVEEAPKEEAVLSIEEQAKATGWKPEGEKTAGEWMRTESLYKGLEARGKEIKELKQTLNEVKQHLTKQEQLGYQKALKDLEAQRIAAIESGDVSSVESLDKDIKVATDSLKPESNIHPVAQEFLNKYQDLMQDPSYKATKMRDFISKRDEELTKYNLTPEKHMSVIEQDLKSEFSDYFKSEAPKQAKHVVESDATPVTAKKAKYKYSDLSPEQQKCYTLFEKRGIMKGSDYIKQLVDLGDL